MGKLKFVETENMGTPRSFSPNAHGTHSYACLTADNKSFSRIKLSNPIRTRKFRKVVEGPRN